MKKYANILYKETFGRDINWDNPTEMNEKIRWQQFNTNTELWTVLADKFLVREFLKENGYDNLLVKLYGVWDRAESIDFENLPDKFVIKTNHGSGGVYIIKDKSTTNLEIIRKQLSKDIKTKYGILTVEPHYYNIQTRIIAEELLEPTHSFSISLVDYKLYCVNGEPLYCAVMFNRDISTHTYNVKLYDMEWNDCSEFLSKNVVQGDVRIPKPVTLDLMKKFCREVCKQFPFVRMDFYEIDGKLFFGEFTFTPAACTGGSIGKQLCNEIGEKIKL